MHESAITEKTGAPTLALLASEPLRAAYEYASMKLTPFPVAPAGDGHGVVVFPGLATDSTSTRPLRRYCAALGYAAYDWGRGYNLGPRGDIDEWLLDLSLHVAEFTAEHNDGLSLIGWSLGGLYARELAKLMTGRIRQVITIGTPFAGDAQQTNARWLFRAVNGAEPALNNAMLARLRTPPPVPTTSIFSRSDGVVNWNACRHAVDHRLTQDIEVNGSHCGLAWNSQVLAIIGDRLAQDPKRWKRFRATL